MFLLSTIKELPRISTPNIQEVFGAEKEAFSNLTGGLRDRLKHSGVVAVNARDTKLPGFEHLFGHRVGPIDVEQVVIPGYREPGTTSRAAARNKARRAHEETGEASAGADVCFYQLTPNGSRVRWDKLDRLDRALTNQELRAEIRRLHGFLVEEKTIKMYWDIALEVVNGSSASASMYLCIEARSFTEEEFRAFIIEALATRLFYTSNCRGPLIEHLILQNKILKYGYIPYEYIAAHADSQNHIDLHNWMREYADCNPEAKTLLLNTIIQTLPHPIRQMR